MYTKKSLVDLLYLNISGGKLSPDVDVSRSNIAAMLPAAISEAILIYNREENRSQTEQMMAFGGSGHDVNEAFLSTYKLTPVKDGDRTDMYYVELPASVQAVPRNAGLAEVFVPNVQQSYIKVPGPSAVIGITKFNTTFYWYEKQSSGGARLYFWNIGLPVCDHFVRMMVDISDIGEDDILPFPSGFEMSLIQKLTEYYFRVMGIPTDMVANDDQDES